MSETPPTASERRQREYLKKLSSDERRKLRAQKDSSGSILSGFALFGLVGWTVAVPTVLGALLGVWLDKQYPMAHSWTLSLLVAGLTLGCFNAWRWVSEEDAHINAPLKEKKVEAEDD